MTATPHHHARRRSSNRRRVAPRPAGPPPVPAGRVARLPRRRPAFTLVEMIVSIAIVSIVVLACASVMLLAAKTVASSAGVASAGMAGSNAGTNGVSQAALARAAAERIADDLKMAVTFAERTATAATFTVPDRDGDGQPETVRYAWSGAAGTTITVGLTGYAIAPYTLTRQYNNAAPVAVAEDVRSFGLNYLTRTVGTKPEPLPVLN